MQIIEIKIGELERFINSERFKNSFELPISSHRALSQALNPRADQDDVVLIVAWDDQNNLLGYIGALPDTICGTKKVAWNSCWYANAKAGKTAAMHLLMLFMKRWQGRILMHDLTEHTARIINYLPHFKSIRKIEGSRFFLRFYIADWLSEKIPSLRILYKVFRVDDFLLNAIVSIHHLLWKVFHPRPAGMHLEIIEYIDAESEEFIDSHNRNELFRRGKAEWEWICQNPWVIQDNKSKQHFPENYYFSSVARSMTYNRLKVFAGKKVIGFMILKERNGHFDLPCFYAEEPHCRGIVTLVMHYLLNQKCRSLTLFNPIILTNTSSWAIPSLYSRTITRELVISNELSKDIKEDQTLQDGDGDVAFT